MSELRERIELLVAAVVDRDVTGDASAVERARALLAELTDLEAERPPAPAADPATQAAFHDLLGEWARAHARWDLAEWSHREQVRREEEAGVGALERGFSWQKLANAIAFGGSPADARAAHHEALRLLDEAAADPGYRAHVLFDWATTLTVERRWADALAAFEASLRELDAEGADDEIRGVVWVNRAIALAGAGRREEAEAAMAHGEALRGWIDPELHAAMDAAAGVPRIEPPR